MYRSLFEKEWIKIKWGLLAYLLISIVAVLSIASDIHYGIKVHGAMKMLTNLITYQTVFFGILKGLVILAGIAIAFFQFLPESLNKRYRLSFHLPISENRLLLFNLSVGVATIVVINIFIALFFFLVISIFYPHEVVSASVMTMIPWFMAGIIGYLGTATAISEPSWSQRIMLGIMTYFTLLIFTKEQMFNQHTQVLSYYCLLILLYSFIILFPGHRLRKGAK